MEAYQPSKLRNPCEGGYCMIVDLIKPWLQDNGLISTQTVRNGNMTGATGQLMALLIARGEKDSDLYKGFQKALYSCSPKPGILSRYPTPPIDTSIDDYLCVAAGCPNLAAEMLDRGKHGFGFMSVKEWPPLAQWLGRFPSFWIHCLFSVGIKPNFFLRCIWSLSVFMAAKQPTSNQDAWMQSHMMIMAYKRQQRPSWICEKAVNYWISKKTLPMRDIVNIYLGNIPQHPLVMLWDDFYI